MCNLKMKMAIFLTEAKEKSSKRRENRILMLKGILHFMI